MRVVIDKEITGLSNNSYFLITESLWIHLDLVVNVLSANELLKELKESQLFFFFQTFPCSNVQRCTCVSRVPFSPSLFWIYAVTLTV